MHKDLYHAVKPVLALDKTASTTAEVITGEIVDTKDFESGQVALITTDYSVGTVAIKDIQESDDSGMSGGVAIADARLIGSLTAQSAVGVTDIGFVRTKRYVQPRYETVGASVSVSVMSTINLGHSDTTRVSVS